MPSFTPAAARRWAGVVDAGAALARNSAGAPVTPRAAPAMLAAAVERNERRGMDRSVIWMSGGGGSAGSAESVRAETPAFQAFVFWASKLSGGIRRHQRHLTCPSLSR